MQLVLIAAQSLDGFITKHSEPGTGFTSAEDKRFFREAVAGFDVCFFGAGTYRVSRDFIRHRLPDTALKVVLTRAHQSYAADAAEGKLEFTDADPATLVGRLRGRGFKRGAILGGSQIHSLFFAADLVDELWITVEPVLFGAGTPLLRAPVAVSLELQSTEHLSPHTLLLRYRVVRRAPGGGG